MFRKSVVIKAPKLRMKKAGSDYKSIWFFCFLVCGVIFGVMLSAKGGDNWHHFFKTLILNHITARQNATILIQLCGAFAPLILLLVAEYIFGLCGVGLPFIYLTLLAFGVYSGLSGAEYYCDFALKGLAVYGCVILPCNAIAAATLIKCSCYSSQLSNYVFSLLFHPKIDRKDNILKEYSIKYIGLAIPLIIGSLLNCASFEIFGRLFGFFG